jgi:hypothetical protein
MSVEIVQGEDKVFSVKLKDGNGNDYDLTGFTELTAEFAGTPNLAVTQTGGAIVSANPACGKLDITLTDVQTLTLTAGESQDLEVIIDKGTDRTIVQLAKVLKVRERLII